MYIGVNSCIALAMLTLSYVRDLVGKANHCMRDVILNCQVVWYQTERNTQTM